MDNIYYFLIIIGIVLFIVILYIAIYNKLNKLSIKVDEAASGIDVALSKRYDVLTKMIEVVKGYAKHEKETLFSVINLRDDMSIKEKIKANSQMNEDFSKINLLVENYPNLKASENFIYLQKTVVDVEEHLQAARRMYNSNVSLYNECIATFPSMLIARIHNFRKKDFFESNNEEKESVKVDI